MLKRLYAVVFLLGAVACGGSSSPTTPSSGNVAGTWLGTMQFTQTSPGGTSIQSISISLTQSGTAIGGAWTTIGGADRFGTVGGSVANDAFSGSLTYNTTSSNSTLCFGTLAISGTITGNSLTWTSPLVVENCTNPPTNLTFNAVRQ